MITGATPMQGSDSASWTLLAPSPSEFVAAHLTSVAVTAPAFERVDLARYIGARLVTCRSIPAPTLVDNGTRRVWQYRVSRPLAGPCAGAGGDFIAIGMAKGQETRTPRVP